MPESKNSHTDEAVPSSPPKPLASWYAQGLSDGLGDRLLMFDNSAAPSLELLRFRPEFSQVPGFETALRERVHRLGQFRHPAFAAVRSVQRLEPGEDLALISNCTPGKRLSEVLHHARGPAFAAALIRHLAPALVLLQQHDAGISHGVLSPGRIVVSPEGGLTIVEHVVGPAIDTLNLGTAQLASIGIALPPAAGGATARLDVATDWYQLGLVAVSVLIGRPVTAGELPQLETLLDGLSHSASPDGPRLSPFIRQWLDRTLQISGTRIETGADARAALDELLHKERPRDARRLESSRHEEAAPSVPSPTSRTNRLAALTRDVPEASPAIVTPTRDVAGDGERRPRPIALSPVGGAPVPPPTDEPSPLEVRAPTEARQRPPQVSTLSDEEPFASEARHLDSARGAPLHDPHAAAVPRPPDPHVSTGPRPHDPHVAAGPRPLDPHVSTGPRPHDPDVAGARPRLHDPDAAPRPRPRAVGRWTISTSVVAALALIAAVEAGVIAVLMRAMWLAPHPAIVVETAASGENVLVSSRSTTATPLQLTVAADLRWMRVTSPSSAGVLGGKGTDTAAGTIRISSPIELKVFEQSRLLGSVPGAGLKVPAGRHDIELVNLPLGYRLRQAVEVEAGQTVSIHVAPPPGWVTIDASPWAEVSIDGQAIGRTPLGPLPLAPGEHHFTFRHPAGGNDRQRVTVRSEAKIRVIGNLRP